MRRFLLFIFVWIGARLWKYVDVYAPTEDEVIGITFSKEYGYIKKISKIK